MDPALNNFRKDKLLDCELAELDIQVIPFSMFFLAMFLAFSGPI